MHTLLGWEKARLCLCFLFFSCDLVAPVLLTRPIVTLENHGSTPTAAWPCKS